LFGLRQALAAQKKTAEIPEVDERFHRAWARADVRLATSTF
jgi:hypothetical protein